MFSIGIRIQEMKQNNSTQSYRNLRDGAADKEKGWWKHCIFVVNKNTITSRRHTYTSNPVHTTRCSRVEKKEHWTA
jgi:hypothetical protein